jgi:hypothetical protein
MRRLKKPPDALHFVVFGACMTIPHVSDANGVGAKPFYCGLCRFVCAGLRLLIEQDEAFSRKRSPRLTHNTLSTVWSSNSGRRHGPVFGQRHGNSDRAKRVYERSHDLCLLEVAAASGRRALIEKVAVCNEVVARRQVGMTGEFFVDQIFQFSQSFRCQLFGIKADGVAVLDSRDSERRSEGFLPRGIGVERLRDAPAEWSLQFEALGLNPQ